MDCFFPALSHGHIGQVRFLVTVECTTDNEKSLNDYKIEKTTDLDQNKSDVDNQSNEIQHSKQNSLSSIQTTSINANNSNDTNLVKNSNTIYSPSQSIDNDHLSVDKKMHKRLKLPHFSDNNLKTQNEKHRNFALNRRSSMNPCNSIPTKLKVLSGGEGLEHFIKKDPSSPPQIGRAHV